MEPRVSQRLVAALREADPQLPPALEVFDSIAGAAPPDFLEWSARASGELQANRLTYYFDASTQTRDALARVGERFSALAAALDVALPDALAESYERLVLSSDGLLQVVLGIDEAAAARRLKLYVIMKAAAPALVNGLLDAIGVTRPPSLDAERVYILGLDFGREGVVDAKLYYRLEVARLRRVVSNLADVPEIFAATREVVLQRCVRSGRTQLYLHADNERAIATYLARRATPATNALLARARAVQAALRPQRVAPWIISFGFREHRLELDASNVYFHLVDTPRSAEYDPARSL